MKCPVCGKKSMALDTREQEDGTIIRKRKCSEGHKIVTKEEDTQPRKNASLRDKFLVDS